MVLASAACFGTLAILVKLAYRESLDLYQVLAYRFALSAIGMIVLATLAGQSPLRLSRRRLAILLLMGVAYSAQAFSFFAALRMLSASLTELVLYTYPTFVALASWLLLRRPVRPLHLLALPLSFIGVALLIGGASFTASVGLVFAFGAPLVYTGYILTGDRVMQGTPPLAATATTLSGTALVLCIVAALAGQVRPPASVAAWLVLAALAIVPTMLAVSLFLAALPSVGGAEAALLSTSEPVVTVALAIALLGERLAPLQLLGAALVLLAVLGLQWPNRRRKRLTEE